MSGEETLAQVYREVESPKLKNFKKAAFIVFLYSLIFTAGVSFLAVLLIPDEVRMSRYADNLIGGLAMSVAGPVWARLLLNGFVVIVGFLILSGAVNTAIIGSNGVLNRVAEDGVVPDWLQKPHRPLRHDLSHARTDPGPAADYHSGQPGRRDRAGRGVCLRRGLEFRVHDRLDAGAAVQEPAASRVLRAAEHPRGTVRDPDWVELCVPGAVLLGHRQSADQGNRHEVGRRLHVGVSACFRGQRADQSPASPGGAA